MGNTIDVTNNTDVIVKVIVSPTPDWPLVDLFSGALPIQTDRYVTINSMHNLWEVWNFIILQEDHSGLSDLSNKVKVLFDNYGMPVAAGKMCNMYDADVFDALERISKNAMDGFRGVFEVTMTIMIEDRSGKRRLTQFQSMTNYSWKVHKKYVARIKHGTLWEDGVNLKEFRPL